MSLNILSLPAAGPLRGEPLVPGDKSISHRAILFASLADGISEIRGFLEGEDTLATARAFAAMGVRIEKPEAGRRIVHGVGIDGLDPADGPLDCGNAGTGMRLLAGLLAGQRFDTTLIGDASLSRRPMRRIIEPLHAMGARIEAADGDRPPLHIHGGRALVGIDYTLPVASAQVKSCLLLAGLQARGRTELREPHPTRDHSERMLARFGVRVEHRPGFAALDGGQRLRACTVEVPGDPSSAAFPLLAALLVPGSELVLRAVGINPRRSAFLDTLREMGADITPLNLREQGDEPVADLRVRASRLRGVVVPEERVPDMIDEFPALFVAAALAEGDTQISGAAELRVKESDRIAVMVGALRSLGAEIEERPDGARIRGGRLRGGRVDSAGDHRCAMALLVAGLCAEEPVEVLDCANVATSFPGFVALMQSLGAGIAAVE